MIRPLWLVTLVLLAASVGPFWNWISSGEVAAQTQGPSAIAQAALLQPGGLTIGGPGVEVVGVPRVFGGDGRILDTCARNAGGVAGNCAPLDVCVTFVNLGSQPVTVGFIGPPGDALVSLLQVVPERSQTSCVRGVVSIDLNPVTATDNPLAGGIAVPAELHWRIDLMPAA